MAPPVLFGATYSVYTRICRLALEEKGVPYRLEEVDVFAPDGPPPDYLRRQPFGKIPAFEHDGFALYESGAISRYVDEAFDGPPLQPQDPQPRARMNQTISILDSYAYRAWVWGLFVERVRKPLRGATPNETAIAAALPKARAACDTLADILAGQPFLCGARISLADLHAAPMLACLTMTPEGQAMIGEKSVLAQWWVRLRLRPAMAATRGITEF